MRTRHESPGRGSHRTAPGPGPFGTCGPIVSRLHAPRQDRVPRRLIRTTIDAAAKRMKLVPFQMERWQSTWEHRVEFNLSESGVEPLPLRELLRDEAAVDRFLNHPLAYSQGNGTPELRSSIASLYPGTTPDHVLVTYGSSEACLLALWHLDEPGDEDVLLLPNYMEGWVVGPPETIATLWAFHDYTTLTPTYLSDRLAQIALSPGRREEILGRTRSILQRNYGLLSEWIAGHGPLFTHIPPVAGAICFL